jgi:hypothetical protein
MKPETLKTSTFYIVMIWVCLLILPLNTKSQSEPYDMGVEGAVWYFSQNYYPFGVGNPYQIRPLRITYLGDTLIQEKESQMLHMESVEQPVSTSTFLYSENGYIYLHNDSGRIFYFDYLAEKFKLVFDFNAEIGESWYVQLPCEDSTLVFGDFEGVVDSVNFEITNITWMDTLVYPLKIMQANTHWSIIERIGMPAFFLPYPAGPCQHLGHEDFLYICSYYDPEVGLIKFQDYDCTTTQTVSSVNSPELLPVIISPNSANESISIQLPESITGQQNVQVEIFNQLGQRVLYQRLDNATVSIGQLPAGMYFVNLQSDGLVFQPQKLVVYGGM